MVKLFNFWYFFFIILSVCTSIALYFLLKNKSDKTKKIVIGSILFFNLALHFLKLTFPPYSTDKQTALSEIFYVNICATSTLFFPFIFISKSNTAKDYMVYLGIISGISAMLYPTVALDENVLSLDVWRFYICHSIIWIAPLLTTLLGLHELDVRRILKTPICIIAILLFIICNQVLQSELGIVDLCGEDFFDVNYHNPSLIWGPEGEVSFLFSWLTPSFMKVVPFGEFAGQEKYWPLFWLMPAVVVYSLIFSIVFCFIFNYKNTVNAFKSAFKKIKSLIIKK